MLQRPGLGSAHNMKNMPTSMWTCFKVPLGTVTNSEAIRVLHQQPTCCSCRCCRCRVATLQLLQAQHPPCCCSMWAVAVCSEPRPNTHARAIGALHQQPSYCSHSCCAAIANSCGHVSGCSYHAAACQLLPLHCTRTSPFCCCSMWAATHCDQPPCRSQLWGYWGAAPAAVLPELPQLSCRGGYSSRSAAVIMQQHVSFCFCIASVLAA